MFDAEQAEAAEKERRYRESLKILKALRPIDDDFMRVMFKDNIPLVQLVLRIIIGKPDLIITECRVQADMKRVTGARSLCLDAYGTDSQGNKYDLEIQRDDRRANPQRARYHSSVMDVENLEAGMDFEELPDTFTIFITEKDYFSEGNPLYRFERIECSSGRPLNDGSTIIYVNGEYRGDDELGKLMHDFNCHEADEMNYRLMSETTRYYKESQGVNEMCKSIEELCHQAEKWGEVRGINVRNAEILAKMKELGYSEQAMVQLLGSFAAEQQ